MIISSSISRQLLLLWTLAPRRTLLICLYTLLNGNSTKGKLRPAPTGFVPKIHDRMLGVILNKTNVKMLERYEGNFGKYRYHNYYAAATDSIAKDG